MSKLKCSIIFFVFIFLNTHLIAQSKQVKDPSREITKVDTSKQLKTLDVGYLELPINEITGSISSIGNQDFNQGLMVSPQELIIGRMPGVSVISNDGAPGANAQILIRGGSSLFSTNEPMVVIDGLIVSHEGFSGLRNPLSMLSPQSIEQITVLKDASAAAIYGTRAKNGVVLINTKRGQLGSGFKVNYNTQFSIGTLPKRQEVFDASGFRNFIQERVATGDFSGEAADLLGTSNTDWQDEIYQTALNMNHQIAFSGAIANKAPFRVSLGYLNHEGVVRSTGFERMSAALSLDPSFFKNQLKFRLDFKGSFAMSTYVPEQVIPAAVYFDPTQAVRTNQDLWEDISFGRIEMTLTDPIILLSQIQ